MFFFVLDFDGCYAHFIQHFLMILGMMTQPWVISRKTRASWQGIGGHLGRGTAECAPMQVFFLGIRFLTAKSWKNLLTWKDDPWEKASTISWVSRKFRLGQKYGSGRTRALVFNISRTLLWSNTYFPVTSANPVREAVKKSLHTQERVEKPVCFTRSCSCFFSRKILHSKSDQDCSQLVEDPIQEIIDFCFLSWRHPKEIDTLSFFFGKCEIPRFAAQGEFGWKKSLPVHGSCSKGILP